MKYGLIYVITLVLLTSCTTNLNPDNPPDHQIQAKTSVDLETKTPDIAMTPTVLAREKSETKSEPATTEFAFPVTPMDCNPVGWWRGNLIYGDSNYDKTILKMEFRDGYVGEIINGIVTKERSGYLRTGNFLDIKGASPEIQTAPNWQTYPPQSGFAWMFIDQDGAPSKNQSSGIALPIHVNRYKIRAEFLGECNYMWGDTENYKGGLGIFFAQRLGFSEISTDWPVKSRRFKEALINPASRLPVTPKTNQESRYDRDSWGNWTDSDGDCQDTRAEVLIAQSLIPVTFKNSTKCIVDTGLWIDQFTGNSVQQASELDIDHIVPLKDAHLSGAWQWDDETKRSYFNYLQDPNHLIAVSASSNRTKGAKTPDKWMPENPDYQCQYAQAWIAVKNRWNLTATNNERGALKLALDTCEQDSREY